MTDKNKELSLDELEGVAGGTDPININVTPKMPFRNTHAIPLNTANEKDNPMEGVNINTEVTECPKCHSMAIKFDQVGGAYMCQDCGNIVTIQN